MSRETPESASSKKEAEKISVNREASGHDTEANRSGREREKEENEENEEKQRLEKEEMEVRAADERKMDELRGNIEKMDGNLPLYRKDGRVCMPGWNIEEKGDENGKKMEETSEEGSKSGEGVETAIPDDKKEASGDTGKSDAGEANGNKDEEKGPEKIVPEEIGSDEAEKENIEKIVPEEIEKDKEEKADAEVKTDDTKEKKDEKPKTGPERETEKEPGLSDLKGEIDYTIRTAEKKKLESMTGEPDKEVKQEKKEDKETLKAEEVETTPDNGSSPEEKPETERVKTAAREKMIIPESKSSKFRKETTKEIDGLWETVRTGGDKEKKRAYDLILELGGPQMVATGSDEMFKATKMTEMAVASGNLYEMYIAARMSEAAVNTLSTAMGAQIEMTKATTEQKKLLNRIINGGSVGFSEWVDKRGKQPEVGTFTHNLNNSQENNLWQAVMRKDKKNSEKALRILLDKTNRAKEYPGISKDYQMESIIHDGRMHFDITWKDEDGKEHNLHYMLDGTALGEKAYKPSLKNYIHPMKKYPTVFTIAEGVRGGEAENPAQPETAASGNAARPEGNQTEVSKEAVKKYPKNAAFIADFRELYEGQDDSLKAIDRLENRLIGGKVGKAKSFLDKFIFSAEEDIKTLESELEGMEGKDKKKQKEFFEKMKELLKKAKDARRELDKEKEDRKEKPEGDEHPDVLAMKDLEPGDVAIVKKDINGVERELQYRMEIDRIVYLSRETEDGELAPEAKVGKNVIITKGVNGVLDIEIIKGKTEEDIDSEEENWEKRKKELVNKYPELRKFTEFHGQAGRSGRYSLIPGEFYEKLNENEKNSLGTYLFARGNTLEIREGEALFENASIEAKYLTHITAGEWDRKGKSDEDLKDIKKIVGELLDGTFIGDFDYLVERSDKEEADIKKKYPKLQAISESDDDNGTNQDLVKKIFLDMLDDRDLEAVKKTGGRVYYYFNSQDGDKPLFDNEQTEKNFLSLLTGAKGELSGKEKEAIRTIFRRRVHGLYIEYEDIEEYIAKRNGIGKERSKEEKESKESKETIATLDRLNGSDVKEGDEFVIYADTGEKFRLWREDGMHLETMNTLAYREYRLDDDYLLMAGKECAVSIEGTIKIADQSKLKENEMAVPTRQVFPLGRIEKIESLKEDKK